jgi:hypothetical protein
VALYDVRIMTDKMEGTKTWTALFPNRNNRDKWDQTTGVITNYYLNCTVQMNKEIAVFWFYASSNLWT